MSTKHARTAKPERPKGKRAAKKPPRNPEPLTGKNRSARDGWTAAHWFEGKLYPPVENPKAWYSIPEVVAKLGLSIKTVKKLVAKETVSSKRHGYYRLVSKADVDKLGA